MGRAAAAGRTSGFAAIFRISGRELQALRMRSRYRRASTVHTGQVRPLTTIVLAKNPGFHIGGTSLAGLYGPAKPLIGGRRDG
jgi:hypothetical protein